MSSNNAVTRQQKRDLNARGGLEFGDAGVIFNEDPLVMRRYYSVQNGRGDFIRIITYFFPNDKEKKRGPWGWIDAPKEYNPVEDEDTLIELLPGLTDEQKARIKKDIEYNKSVTSVPTSYSSSGYTSNPALEYFMTRQFTPAETQAMFSSSGSATVAAPAPATGAGSSNINFDEDPINPSGGRRKKTRRRRNRRSRRAHKKSRRS